MDCSKNEQISRTAGQSARQIKDEMRYEQKVNTRSPTSLPLTSPTMQLAPSIITATAAHRIKIVKEERKLGRMCIKTKLFDQLDQAGHEKLAIGFSKEIPGYLLVTAATAFSSTGCKTTLEFKTSVCRIAIDSILIKHLFPMSNATVFIPKRTCLYVDPNGIKLIAFEFPKYDECFMEMRQRDREAEEIRKRMSSPVMSRQVGKARVLSVLEHISKDLARSTNQPR